MAVADVPGSHFSYMSANCNILLDYATCRLLRRQHHSEIFPYRIVLSVRDGWGQHDK